MGGQVLIADAATPTTQQFVSTESARVTGMYDVLSRHINDLRQQQSTSERVSYKYCKSPS